MFPCGSSILGSAGATGVDGGTVHCCFARSACWFWHGVRYFGFVMSESESDDRAFVSRGSWATRRRALMRSRARKQSRGSTFWASFLAACHLIPRGALSVDSSSTPSAGSSYRGLDGLDAMSGMDLSEVGAIAEAPATDASLGPCRMSQLLQAWTTSVLSCRSGFGCWAADFLGGRCSVLAGRCRDLLPLPLADACVLEYCRILQCTLRCHSVHAII